MTQLYISGGGFERRVQWGSGGALWWPSKSSYSGWCQLDHDDCILFKGRDPYKKVAYFRALPESGGGGFFTDAQIFWPFFYQVKVPKIGTFLLKSHNICMFFW